MLEQTSRASGAVRVRQLQPAIGAEILGLDLREKLTEDHKQLLREALLAHGVIFIPRQEIGEAEFLALGEVFGTLGGDEPGELLGTLKSAGGAKDQSANVWHSDGCYLQHPPPATLLRALQASPLGGDTCFSSAVAAYEGLPEDLKARIRPLRYRSSFAFIISRYMRFTSPTKQTEKADRLGVVEQPVVRVHPETGALVLYVNDSQTMDIVGLDPEEGAALLRRLTDEIKRPEYQMRWKWSDGDIAIWDNRAVQHYGVPDQVGDRIMQRVTVVDTQPAIQAA